MQEYFEDNNGVVDLEYKKTTACKYCKARYRGDIEREVIDC